MKRYKEEGRLLTYGMIGMLILSLPFTPFLFPFADLQQPGMFALKVIGWVTVFMLGQLSFFLALRYFEASRLSSLLGLKIIVLALRELAQRQLRSGLLSMVLSKSATPMFQR